MAANFLPAALLQALGQCLGITTLLVFTIGNVTDPSEAGTVSGWLQICRLSGIEMGVAAVTTLLRLREQHASNLIGLQVTSGALPVQELLSALAHRFAAVDPAPTGRSVATLATPVRAEAHVIACIDVFWILAWLAVAALLLLMLARPPARRL